jgi:hypothetical protein
MSISCKRTVNERIGDQRFAVPATRVHDAFDSCLTALSADLRAS